MPIVPRRNGQIGTAPLPGVRVSPSAPDAAFGVPGNGIDVTTPWLSIVEPMARKAKRDSLQIGALDGDNQAAQAATDAETQILSRRGKNALDNSDVFADYDKRAAEIEKSLPDEIKLSFRQSAMAKRQSLYSLSERHGNSEHQAYDDDTTEAALNARAQAVLDAYSDPTIRQQSFDETRAILTDQASRNGWSKEVTDQKIATRLSGLNFGVIQSYLNDRQDVSASDYYANNKDAILPSERPKIEKALKAAAIQQGGLRAADTIVADQPSVTEALRRAEAIDDPDVKKEAVQNVMTHFNLLEHAQDMDRRDAASRLIKELETNGGRLNKGSADWQLIDGDYPERNHVLAAQDDILHPKDKGDPGKLLSYQSMWANHATRSALLDVNVSDIVNDKTLSPGQKTEILNWRLGAQREARAAELTDLRQKNTDLEKSIKDMQRTVKTKTDAEGNALTDDALKQVHDDLLDSQARSMVLQLQMTRARQGETLTPGTHLDRTDTPAPTAASSTNPFGLSAPKPITPSMVQDIQKHGQGYADYLKSMGYAVPAVIPKGQP